MCCSLPAISSALGLLVRVLSEALTRLVMPAPGAQVDEGLKRAVVAMAADAVLFDAAAEAAESMLAGRIRSSRQ